MRIAFCTDGIYPFSIGGIQKNSFYQIKYLARKGVLIDVFFSKPIFSEINIENFFNKTELKQIKFISLKYPKLPFYFPGHYLFSEYYFSKKIDKVLNLEDYKIVYCQGFTSLYLLKKHPNNFKIISNLHGLNMFQISLSIKSKINDFVLSLPAKYVLKKSLRTISLGGELTKILMNNGVPKKNIRLQSNGIDQKWLTIKNEKKTEKKIEISYVGRFDYVKGIQNLNYAILNGNFKNLSFNFIGPIPRKHMILSENVTYYGEIIEESKIMKTLSKSDFLICPSYSEGMPTVILEAMGQKCAIIATNVGAVSELVCNKNGFLIKDNHPTTLINVFTIIENLNHKTIEKLKLKSSHKVRNFIWENVIDNTMKIFNEN